MIERLNALLVDNWRSAWRWWSVQSHMIASTALVLFQMLPIIPSELQDYIPQPWGAILTLIWIPLGLYARLAKQKDADDGAE